MAGRISKASAPRHLVLITAALVVGTMTALVSPLAHATDPVRSPIPAGSAPIQTTSGVLRDAQTGSPIQDGCVGWRPISALDTDHNHVTTVNESGAWSFDSSRAGSFFLFFYVASAGNCRNPVDLTYVPSWFENQPYASGDIDPLTALPPVGASLTKVAAGSTGVIACLGTDALPDTCAIPDTTLSGRVVGVGPKPIRLACVLAFGQAGFLGGAITDADGRWTIPDLPVDAPLMIGVLPPFDLGDGPCVFGDGLPAPPTEGELQPEFYGNTWIDLADPRLVTQTFAYGVDRGARVLTNSADGINVCLTTDPGNVAFRGSCAPTSPLLLFFGRR